MEQWRGSAWNLLSLRNSTDSPVVVLTHGQLSSEVLLVMGDSIVITSWAKARLGCPLTDLALLILSSCSSEDRTQHSRHLMETYHFTFTTVLARLGGEISTMFPMLTTDWLVDQLER